MIILIEIVELGRLNKLAKKDMILLINTSSSLGKVVFEFVRNAKSLEFPKNIAELGGPGL